MNKPEKLYLIGGGRHIQTRNLRRANRFPRRVVRIGELTIRHQRADVDLDFVRKHLQLIITEMRKGSLIVAHSADKFVDEAELLEFFSDELEPAALLEAPEFSDPHPADADDIDDNVPGDFNVTALMETSPVLTEPEEAKTTELEEAKTEDAPKIDDAVKDAPKAEGSVVEGFEKELPDLTGLVKKQLVALCQERGIEVPASPSNAVLVDLLTAWKNS
jgi:hypothetical protein